MIFISGYVGLVEVKTVNMIMSAVYANTTMEELKQFQIMNATSTGQVSNLKRFIVIWFIFKKRSSKGMEHGFFYNQQLAKDCFEVGTWHADNDTTQSRWSLENVKINLSSRLYRLSKIQTVEISK